MKKIFVNIKLFLLISALTSGVAFSYESVDINLTGSIPKFVKIQLSLINPSIDLESAYDQESGTLAGVDYKIAELSAISNSANGYSISASSSNNFQLLDQESTNIAYTISIEESQQLPENATLSPVGNGSEMLIDIAGSSSFTGATLSGGNLILSTQTKSNFLIGEGIFTDSLRLEIKAK